MPTSSSVLIAQRALGLYTIGVISASPNATRTLGHNFLAFCTLHKTMRSQICHLLKISECTPAITFLPLEFSLLVEGDLTGLYETQG
ncbi:hypothetical protein EV361DRAFT_886937 [Lentinula raphanica]|nr:hypothetical protein EV361DRAFT_886937 [Lentinula raphanica]